MEDLKGVELKLFKQAQYKTTVHTANLITKCMRKTLSTITILQLQGHATTNICLCCGLVCERIQHMYLWTHKGSRGRWTSAVDALRKCLKDWNTVPDITIILVDALLYIAGERNDLPQRPSLTLQSDIHHIGWPSIILGFISTSLAHTQQTHFTHKGSKKWDSNGPANSLKKSGNLSKANGSTTVNSRMQEKCWTIKPRNWSSTPNS